MVTAQSPSKTSRWFVIGSSAVWLVVLLTTLVVMWNQLSGASLLLGVAGLLLSQVLLAGAGLFQQRRRQRLLELSTSQVQQLLDSPADKVESPPLPAQGRLELEFSDALQQLVAQHAGQHAALDQAESALQASQSRLQEIADDSAQRLNSQQESLAFIRSRVEQMMQTITTAEDVGTQTSALARQSEEEGGAGKLAMTEAITGVMMLGESVNEAGQIISTLGEDSKSIGGIIEVIRGVAEQTNLLALNAAIEAARAGEQGRGFAVVADEVRSLASQTQSSAQQISDIINQLLGHVEQATGVIRNSVEHADKSDELMENVTISYSELVGHMNEVNHLAAKLQQAVDEDYNETRELLTHLDNIQQANTAIN